MSSDRALRVAYVTWAPPKYSETFITAEVEQLRTAGVDVALFSAVPRQHWRAYLLVVIGALRRPGSLGRAVRLVGPSYGIRGLLAGAAGVRLSRGIRKFRTDVIHVHFLGMPLAAGLVAGSLLDRPVTAMGHAGDYLTDRRVVALRKRVMQLRRLFVISNATAHQLEELEVVTPGKPPVSVVRASYSTALLHGVSNEAVEVGPNSVVSVARLVPKKGIDTAILAMDLLRNRGIEIRYRIYGDGPEYAELDALIRRLRLVGLVTLCGAVTHYEAVRAVASAEVALLPCRRTGNGDMDGIPVFLMEAAYLAKPVVTTAISGIPELVSEDSGWLIPPDDPAAIADALEESIHTVGEAAKRGAALRQRLQAEFAAEIQVQRLAEGWRRL